MKKLFESKIVAIGLAIFSMLFGAGNLLYPIQAGLGSAGVFVPGVLGLIIAAVGLPLVGLVAIILFDGDYRTFFQRVGVGSGNFLIFMSMLLIGPLLAMPRIVTVAHVMLYPFLPTPLDWAPIFAVVFLVITFFGAFKEGRIVDLLGYFVTPALLVALGFIIIRAIMFPAEAVSYDLSGWTIFMRNLNIGFGTLDLFGTIFFGSIVISILKQNLKSDSQRNLHRLAMMALWGGVIGCGLLGLVYLGLAMMSMYHGHLFVNVVADSEIFREISMMVVGGCGAAALGIAVLMACFSTAIALSAVVAEYMQRELNDKISYAPALVITLLLTYVFSTLGLDNIMIMSIGPIASIGYPVVITLTFANLAYKLWGFKPVKLPVACVAILTTTWYLYSLISPCVA